MKIDSNSQSLVDHSVNRIEAIATYNDKSQLKSAKPTSKLGSSNNIMNPSTDSVTVKLSLPKQTVDTLQRLGNLNDFLANVATNLKKTEDGLKSANSSIEQMKAELEKIVKNFPPFNIDSQERKQILMSYSSIRKEISGMTFPPPPQPIYERVNHIWQDIFGNDTNQKISTPEVPDIAPDAHVNSALQRLEGTQAQIQTLRTELGNSLLSGKEAA